MKMQHITINTMCMEESIRFYQEIVGLTIQADMRGKGSPIVFLANGAGETSVELIADPDHAYTGSGISIGFGADDVEAKREELLQAGYEVTPMIAPNPHVKFFFVTDPNGIKIQFI